MAEEDDAVEETGETRMIYARLDQRDRGRAWVVLAASFLVQLLMDGTVSSYGVLLTNMRNDTKFKEAGYTEAEFNIPGAIQPCLYIFMIGLACPLVNAFGFRWVAIAGGILSGLSMVISSYCQDLISFTLFFGLFTGKCFFMPIGELNPAVLLRRVLVQSRTRTKLFPPPRPVISRYQCSPLSTCNKVMVQAGEHGPPPYYG
ncbi:hypothetical protein SprV_0100085400 [Sparganum proliferum]